MGEDAEVKSVFFFFLVKGVVEDIREGFYRFGREDVVAPCMWENADTKHGL